jgi:hypothetical protein
MGLGDGHHGSTYLNFAHQGTKNGYDVCRNKKVALGLAIM